MQLQASTHSFVVIYKRRTQLHYIVLFLNCKSFNKPVFFNICVSIITYLFS
ncbi:hypothetical protein HanHA300_Chr11g0418121 [Helianthus annuus]|nr:hypothetical protein HanHA300_Chr11g0418121 [Helianthus annuus]KAJ0511108.1 hypothetical protein HanIR_Chr11g0548281 [Helianthus annuus]KAJ0518858.1 hypothetical protein HanHA89_Chr11g0442151 [Helianthus annuus]KAJ0686878.1 hypothetical protein HanLR1_Chr11g0419671 [Helianthus annuus]KAJ0690685.1 hypothetical protein HanOQP8_Chr11g0420591 [Helianthus annuus]